MLNPINQYLISLDGYKLMLSAPKSNLTQSSPHVLNVSYSACESTYESEGFRLEKTRSDSASYHLLFKVFSGKQLLAHLYSDPTKKYGFNRDLRPLHICNGAFYTMPFSELLAALLVAFDLRIHNHSHIHICLFTQQVDPAKLVTTPQQFPDLFTLMKGTRLTYFTSGDGSNGLLTTTYINEDSERVEGIIYNKTKQLNSLKPGKRKQYIFDWFTKNGFDITKDVYSFELKIHAKALSVYKPFVVTGEGGNTSMLLANNNGATKATRITRKTKTDIEIGRLQHPSYLAALFEQFLNIDIRKNDRTRPSNCTRVQLVDFNVYAKESVNKTVSASEQPRSAETRLIKQSLQLLKETNELSYLYGPVQLAIRYNLREQLFSLIAQLKLPDTAFADVRPSVGGSNDPAYLGQIRANFNRLLHLNCPAPLPPGPLVPGPRLDIDKGRILA